VPAATQLTFTRDRLAGLIGAATIIQLLEAHGDKAVAEAAQKASALEKQGESEQAETWRHIEAALKFMRGPHES
jgi:hypothetical protein